LERHKNVVDTDANENNLSPDQNCLKEIYEEVCEMFLIPIIKKLDKMDDINQWYLWKPKALIL
jgi:hypothetical protein